MKIYTLLHFNVLLLVAMLFSIPIFALAQQISVQEEAISDAEKDAAAQVNKPLWFFGGCLGGVLVIIFANIHEPYPPASSLLGKSPEYVSFYTDAFRTKARYLQANQAIRGCAANCIVVAGCYGCMFFSLVLEDPYY